jgi:uncharacterized protein (DUF983 family)
VEYCPQKPAIPHLETDTHWTNATSSANADRRPVLKAMLRGARLRCPNCGSRTLFASYLRVSSRCGACGEELHHHRADDAPPYFTMLITGHIVVPLLMTVELVYGPPVWLHLLIWLPLTVALSLLLLPVVKGAIVGLQWALRMHGFAGQSGGGTAPAATLDYLSGQHETG